MTRSTYEDHLEERNQGEERSQLKEELLYIQTFWNANC
jgi:hypothetical protein